MFEILDQRIKKRREELRQVEAECSALLRQVDRIPRIKEENRDKETEINDIKGNRTESLRGKFEALERCRNLTGELDKLQSQIDVQESALSELNGKLEKITEIENLIRERGSEIEVLNAFIETYGGPEKFRTTASYLLKDLKLLESELEKIRISHEKDLEMISDRREACEGQKERLKRQIEAATVQEVDREKLVAIQASERAAAMARDVSLGIGAICLVAGFTLSMALGNLHYLLAFIGAVPAWGCTLYYLSRVRQAVQTHQQLQQQLYAFNISQRGVLELQESLEEVSRKLIEVNSEFLKIEKVKRKLEDLRIDCFSSLEESLKLAERGDTPELAKVIHLCKEILNGYSEFRNLIGDDGQPFRGMGTFNPDRLVSGKMEKRVHLEDEIARLGEETARKPLLVEQTQEVLSLMAGLKSEYSRIASERGALGVTEADLPKLKKEEDDLKDTLRRLEIEIEENNNEIEKLEKLGAQAALLEVRRKNIIDEIDEDLIKHYELKEATYDIDYSAGKFEELRNRAVELEGLAEDYRQNIRDAESERKMVHKDLDRIPEVQSEIDAIKSDINEKETYIMKLRELENLYKQTGLNIRKRLVPQIEAYFGWILPKMTRGRYHRVRLDDSFEIKVLSEEYGGFVNLDVLSGGTVDQLLISLRLAFARATSMGAGASSPLLFLDEPFSSFDEVRREQFFNLLRIMKGNFQQIFLISHLPNLEDFVDYYMRLDLEKGAIPSYTSWSR